MAIYRKKGGNVWYAEVYVRDLKRCVCKSTGKTDRDEALDVERMLRAAYGRTTTQQRLHALVDALYSAEAKAERQSGIPLSVAYERYVAQLEATGRTLKQRTLDGRRHNLALFMEWRDANHLSLRRVGEVTRSVAGAYAAVFNATEGLSDKSKHEGINDLGAMWSVLMAVDETIKENPWRFFLKAVRRQRAILAFTPDEERRILDAARGTEWHTACLLSRWTGLRFGDVCALSWGDIDWGAGVIRATPSKTTRHKIAVVVPLAEPLRAALAADRRECGPILPRLNRSYPNTHCSGIGVFADVLSRADVSRESHTFHSWRHTFVTRGGEAGIDRELLMRLAGHSTEEMSRHYDHSERLDDLRGAIAAMSAQASAG